MSIRLNVVFVGFKKYRFIADCEGGLLLKIAGLEHAFIFVLACMGT